MRRALAGAALAFLALTAHARPDMVDSFETLARGRAHAEKGRWFWACEAWLEVLKQGGDPTASAAARERLNGCLRMAELRRTNGALPPAQRFYHDTLKRYILLDRGSLWTRWRALEKEPRYAEEMRWFLWGPSARYFEQAWGDARSTKAADLFAEGWAGLESGNWLPAARRLRACLALRADHFLARQALEVCEARLRDFGLEPAASEFTPTGSPSEKLARGRDAFNRGRWPEALAWFRSVPAAGEEGARARRAARRLDWMFEGTGGGNGK